MKSRKKLNQVVPADNRDSYLSAIREFTKMTITDPTFFDKTPEEQKELASEVIARHKQGIEKSAD